MVWSNLLQGNTEGMLRYDDSMFSNCADAIIKSNITEGSFSPLYTQRVDLQNSTKTTQEEARAEVLKLGFISYVLDAGIVMGGGYVHETFITPDFSNIITLAYYKELLLLKTRLLCLDSSLYTSLLDYFNTILKENKPTKQVYMLMSTASGIGLHSIGSIDEALSKQNYTEEVLTKWASVVHNLESTTPKGRLSIINGPPGVGKTRLIMGLVAEVSSVSNFIIIPPNMISSLVEPSFISAMRSVQGSSILILEDADVCLTRKSRDDMSQLQAVLNFADGIVGQLLDFRLVVTSNVKTEDFDPAILRPGRLCEHIQVGFLGKQQANLLYKELGGVGEPFKGEASLAEIYSLVKDPGRETLANSRKMGF